MRRAWFNVHDKLRFLRDLSLRLLYGKIDSSPAQPGLHCILYEAKLIRT